MLINAAELLRLARLYGEATGLALSTIGRKSIGNVKIFDHLAAGSDCLASSLDRGWRWFADNWPENAAWPADIKRPPTDRAA